MASPKLRQPFPLAIKTRRVFQVLMACALVLVCAHAASLYALRHFDPAEHPGIAAAAGKFLLDSELNVPTWFQANCLLFCAVLLGLNAIASRRLERSDSIYWAGLAVLFCGLSIEEFTGFHELLIFPLRERLNLHGVLYFSWVIPGLAFVAVVGALLLRFLYRQPMRVRVQMIMAAIVYVGGAIGMEMIGGILAEQSHFMGTYTDQSRASPAYLMAATLEEVLEMTGMALFAHALLLRLKSWGVSFAIEFAPTPAAQPLFQHQPGDVETRGLA